MNWGNLGKSGGVGGKRGGAGGRGGGGSSSYGGGGAAGGATAEQAAGLDAAWKEKLLPKEGDELKCKHFKVCAGCEFDRRFDETPIMVDSRCDCKWDVHYLAESVMFWYAMTWYGMGWHDMM